MTSSPPDVSSRRILADGLWHRNAGLVQLLGLCPLLAVSNSVVNGIGLGVATAFVLVATSAAVSLLRPLLVETLRLPMFVLIIASLVTVVELMMQGFFPELDRRLGIFVPLIVTNCAIFARAEGFASRAPLGPSVLDGAATGAGFAAVLIVLGALRELVGQGSLFAGAEQLLGDWAAGLTLQLLPDGLLLAVLPPGAFIGLGLLIAAHRWREQRRAGPAIQPTQASVERA